RTSRRCGRRDRTPRLWRLNLVSRRAGVGRQSKPKRSSAAKGRRTVISARPTADDLATLYACDVIDGKIVAGELVKASCRRHLRDLDGGSARGLTFNVDKAKRHCGFFPAVLTVTEG